MNQTIYFRKEVWETFKDEPDKSKFINQLLADFYGGFKHVTAEEVRKIESFTPDKQKEDDWTVLDIDTLLPQEKKERHPSVKKQLEDQGLKYDQYQDSKAYDPISGDYVPYMVKDGLVVLL